MTTTSPTRASARRMLPALAVVPLLRYAAAVHAVPDDQPWRTACPCGKPLWPNAIRPTGRPSGCGQRLSAPPYTVEAAALLVAAGLVLSGHSGWTLAAYAWWAAGMIVHAFVDLAVMRLPHRITAATTASPLGLLAATGDPQAWWRAVAAGLVLAALFTVLAGASRGQFCWGDMTLAVPVATALGWHSWATVYAGTLLGLGTAAARRDHLAPHRPSGRRGTRAARPVRDRRRHCRRGVAMTSTPHRNTEGTPS